MKKLSTFQEAAFWYFAFTITLLVGIYMTGGME